MRMLASYVVLLIPTDRSLKGHAQSLDLECSHHTGKNVLLLCAMSCYHASKQSGNKQLLETDMHKTVLEAQLQHIGAVQWQESR